jgi:hypothetical protein
MRGHNIPRKSLNYSKLPTPEEIQTVGEYQRQLQLLSGWFPIDEDRIVYEMIASSLLCVSDITASFQIPDPLLSTDNSLQFERWKQFLERNKFPVSLLKREVVNGQQIYTLDLLTFCNCLMRENRNYLTGFQRVTISLSLLNAFIPYFFIFDSYSSLCLASKIYYFASGVLNLVFYWAASGFLLAALEDSIRRYYSAEKLSTFIRAIDIDPRFQLRFQSTDQFFRLSHQYSKLQMAIKQSSNFNLNTTEPILPMTQQQVQNNSPESSVPSFEMSSQSSPTSNPLFSLPTDGSFNDMIPKEYKTLPILKLADYPKNIIVWMYARKLLHNFGARIRFRLDTYCGPLSSFDLFSSLNDLMLGPLFL